MKRCIIASLLMVSSSVFATNNDVNIDASALAVAQSAAAAKSQSTAIGYGGTGIGLGMAEGGLGVGTGGNGFGGSSTSVSGGNSLTQNVNSGVQPGQYTITNNGRSYVVGAPDVFVSSASQFSLCDGAVGLGGSLVGGGGGFSFPWHRTSCWNMVMYETFEKRAVKATNVVDFAIEKDSALDALCAIDEAAVTKRCKLHLANKEKVVPVPVTGEATNSSVWNQ